MILRSHTHLFTRLPRLLAALSVSVAPCHSFPPSFLRSSRAAQTKDKRFDKKLRKHQYFEQYSASPVSTNFPSVPVAELFAPGTQCDSCGVSLQKDVPGESGYFVMPRPKTKKAVRHTVSHLSAVDQRLLLNADVFETDEEFMKFTSSTGEAPHQVTDEIVRAEAAVQVAAGGQKVTCDTPHTHEASAPPMEFSKLICLRCHDAVHSNKFTLEAPSPMNEILRKIPPGSQLVHVINAFDFPHGLYPLEDCDSCEVIYVINKTDLLFPNEVNAATLGHAYFANVLRNAVGARAENVFVASAKCDWSVRRLVKRLGPVTYIVGEVNSGKSTLIKTILNLSSAEHLWGIPSKEVGPGASYFPGFTKENIKYKVHDKLTLVDVPGCARAGAGIYDYMQPRDIAAIGRGEKVIRKNQYHERYETVRGGQAYSMGGFAYVVPPRGVIAQVVKHSAARQWVFSGMEKAKYTCAKRDRSNEKIFSVGEDSVEKLRRYVIPRFHGSIDVVVKGVGYLTIKPTSRKTDSEAGSSREMPDISNTIATPRVISDIYGASSTSSARTSESSFFEIYAPEHVEILIREPIRFYISKSPIANQKYAVFEPRKEAHRNRKFGYLAVPTDKTIFSELVPVPEALEGNLTEYVEKYTEAKQKKRGCYLTSLGKTEEGHVEYGLKHNAEWIAPF
ncbi:hypothetical protein BABINDRAFT_124816 [Babjeviella inositovora NRRL Y-12698]|uniref:Genetic interactor of prohibitins 3, mitochondrial n=1 Tax=Babjeviella inositovora NRRL Y-12698 TaxID=984486 RepID=A0A1E3QS73_9ASCO|nr:uncharacterized protein BABINDRAFT_124816 [Babjeviella inositovora NRRL Y-12698]ODQ80553.1 hypothetical protein BABINDRAFT_124816 [Babjeviella inositovora NRRL Y-12698]